MTDTPAVYLVSVRDYTGTDRLGFLTGKDALCADVSMAAIHATRAAAIAVATAYEARYAFAVVCVIQELRAVCHA